jgi:hypothetical protein
MQPITIEPLSYIALIIIIITLVYSFFNYRKEDKKKTPQQKPIVIKENVDYEKPALVAAIATMMEGKPFKIKRVVLSGKQEKASTWRHFGRQEIMRRRMTTQK